ncbi:MAG: hypothetical protein K2G64_07345, partial [Muribaculaceae bacterium]|nr:hypothetical protein [Muribaculaceae bacterium]
ALDLGLHPKFGINVAAAQLNVKTNSLLGFFIVVTALWSLCKGLATMSSHGIAGEHIRGWGMGKKKLIVVTTTNLS